MGVLLPAEGAAPNAIGGVCAGGMGLSFDRLGCLVLRAGWAISSGYGLVVAVAGITSRNAPWPGAEGDRAVEGEGGGL